ncbi:metal-sensitive transcriptional regulator [Pseudarthrobacter sp. L19]|uniref:metal-sensitive transcriptional regulator n=1 Tax=Pseudarthrobacter sp. L19 TaxID=3423951 RepID=UPI003D7B3823
MSATVAAPSPGASQHRTVNRLKRARGQLTALIDAIESGTDCRAAVTQLAAVRGALDKAGFELISSAMRDCLAPAAYTGPTPAAPAANVGATGPAAAAPPTLEELQALFLRLT